MRWYSFVYRASYRLGFTPWDRGSPASGLVDLVEGPGALPRGRALDLGCGTGTNTIYLAEHGWDATGIDMVASALDVAQRNATRSGVRARFVEGDVTRLPELDLGSPFDLLVDVGCLHTLPPDLRDQYAEGLSRFAAPGAVLFLYAFSPGRLAPMKSGATEKEVVARFRAWDLDADKPSLEGMSGRGWRVAAARYFGAHEYRLRRKTPLSAWRPRISMKVRIYYCRPCGYQARAEALARELRTRFGATVETVPGKLGQFDVFVDDELVTVRSKSLISRLLPPKAPAVVAAIEAAVAAREGDRCDVQTGDRDH